MSTVDGRNPANQLVSSLSRYLQGFIWFYTFQLVVWDFFHQQLVQFLGSHLVARCFNVNSLGHEFLRESLHLAGVNGGVMMQD